MSLKERIDSDLKTALLAGEKEKAMTLRGLKSSLLNAEIETNKRDTGLSDDEVVAVLQKEAKKRQESADLFRQGGNNAKAEVEMAEKELIGAYLPEQLSEEDIAITIDKIIKELGVEGLQAVGQVIGKVKQELGPSADGAVIAKLAKEKLA